MSAYLAENMEPSAVDAELESLRHVKKPALALVASAPETKANTSLHGGVLKGLAGLNVFILAAFAVTFRSDPEAVFMVTISAVYLAAYLITPWVMAKVGGQGLDQAVPFRRFLSEPFETFTGVISGREAMIQVLLVPTAIAIAVTGMSVIIMIVR